MGGGYIMRQRHHDIVYVLPRWRVTRVFSTCFSVQMTHQFFVCNVSLILFVCGLRALLSISLHSSLHAKCDSCSHSTRFYRMKNTPNR